MAGLFRRGKTYYALYYVGGTKKRISLQTASLQIAKEKIRQIESNVMRGEEIALPTKTPLPEILQRYVEYIRAAKTAKSAQWSARRACSVIDSSFPSAAELGSGWS